jgi:Phytanoyl-CoA dioxygenase (PhyH)
MPNLATKPVQDDAPMSVEALLSQDFWHSLAPRLHIAEPSFHRNVAAVDLTPDQRPAMAELLRREGYFQGRAEWGVDLRDLAATVRRLADANILPVFAFLYDEFWLPFAQLHPFYAEILGPTYHMLPDFWIWNIDPKRDEAGWKPHRDRGRIALLPDGSPKSLTTWIPLSNATPLNSCMYIVPAMLDPTYGSEAEDQKKFSYPSIRALPGAPGDFFIWNQAVLHWGSASSPRAAESRVSMAFEFQRTDVPPFNQPLIPPLLLLPFEIRLKLIAKQVLQYRHMYDVDPSIERMARQVLA